MHENQEVLALHQQIGITGHWIRTVLASGRWCELSQEWTLYHCHRRLHLEPAYFQRSRGYHSVH